MAEAAKQSRQDPEIKKELGERFNEIIEKSGLEPAVISFRCGWKSRSRIKNYMTGYRTPGAQELLQLDKVMYPIFGEYVSFYILYGKHISESVNGENSSELNQAVINRAFTSIISDYVEMGRLVPEPKLTASKMLEDFNEVYLKREIESGIQK